MDYIRTLTFNETIIIVSDSLFEGFVDKFQQNIADISIIPKIVVFGPNFPYKKDTPEFFRSGGHKQTFIQLKSFLDSEQKNNVFCQKQISPSYPITEPDEKSLLFLEIQKREDLILPMFYMEKLNHFSEEEFKQSVENLFKKIKEDKNSEPIEFLFSQIIESGNIPSCIFAKFWMRAYSTHKTFVEDMNQDLLNENYKNFLPIIQKIYETVNKNELDHERDSIYKGIYIDYEKWKPIYDSFNFLIKTSKY
jgi:hypothetical protein